MSPHQRTLEALREANMLRQQIRFAEQSGVERNLCGVLMTEQIAKWKTTIEVLEKL